MMAACTERAVWRWAGGGGQEGGQTGPGSGGGGLWTRFSCIILYNPFQLET